MTTPYPQFELIKGHVAPASSDRVGKSINDKIEATQRAGEEVSKGPLDPVFGQHRAFPIRIDPTEIQDSRGPPKDVYEYLARVRQEATGGIDYDDDSDSDGGIYWKRPEPADTSAVSSEPSEPSEASETNASDGLKDYLARRQEYANYRSHLKELDAIDLPDTAKEWKYFVFNNEPTKDFVAQIVAEDQHIKLVVYLSKWLNRDIDPTFARWIFAVLDALDKTLEPKDLSVIRALGKKARKQQDANELDSRNQAIVTQILEIVGNFYGQRDLLL